MFDPRADLFFTNPTNNPVGHGQFGVLYLLRRDVVACLGLDPATGNHLREPILWPGAMATLAGVDLLAKFYAGSDAQGQVGNRFKTFVRAFFQGLTPGDDETLFQLRNSLLHSFGLYSENRTRTYHFHVTAAGNVPFIQQTSPIDFQIDLLVLHQRFEEALARYAAALEGQQELQTKFIAMFTNYGAIRIH